MAAGNKIHAENLTNRGRGRPKGAPNKTTAAIKDMIIQALENKGGVEYIMKQADENPTAFLQLLGKIMPTQISGDADNPLVIKNIQRVIVDPYIGK